MDKQFPSQSLVKLDKCCPRMDVGLSASTGCDRIVTPLQVEAWKKALVDYPDRELAECVVRGIQLGFQIGFDYTQLKCKMIKGKMKSVLEHEEVVMAHIEKELQAERVVGPLSPQMAQTVHVNPFGVIPKKEEGQWRLIVNLAASARGSVNDGIGKEYCGLYYSSVDEIALAVKKHGVWSMLAKFDLKSAYRNVPVHPDDRHLLGMEWKGDVFVDTVLPFGLRSAQALAHIIRKRLPVWVDHYLDDFVLVGPSQSAVCGESLSIALESCRELGFPVAVGKTEGPTSVLTVLGVKIDAQKMELRLPRERLQQLLEMVGSWRKRKCCTKRQLQSLTGNLNHGCKVVRPGRRFLQGIFSLLSGFSLKNHMIRLNAAFRADMEW